ncbi:Arm DNA-binding domain-containing protein [Comamonas sp. lk]|uniref:integrase arm-type DNA-binding domain-containing protein n=1 Tax=Comamonas sp. lk TaxID=2201272 RepID=UPI000EB3EF06
MTDAHCRMRYAHLIASRRASDAGGLYLHVSPSGSKRWFNKYRTDGKEKQLALGRYPAVGLTVARKARDVAKLQRADGSGTQAGKALNRPGFSNVVKQLGG